MALTFKIRGGGTGGVRDSWDRKSFPPRSARTTTSFYIRRIHTWMG